jgi:hypothetical protein
MPTDGVDASMPAWGYTGVPTELDLPVYFTWSFRTGTLSNFEEAARLITPYVLPATVGRRDMDVATAGLGLPAATPTETALPVEGALMSVAAFHEGSPEWPEPEYPFGRHIPA